MEKLVKKTGNPPRAQKRSETRSKYLANNLKIASQHRSIETIYERLLQRVQVHQQQQTTAASSIHW